MSFKDAFTKEGGASLLDYDDGAFYFFFTTTLIVILVPLTIQFVRGLFKPPSYSSTLPKRLPNGDKLMGCTCSLCAAKTAKIELESKSPMIKDQLFGKAKKIYTAIALAAGWLCVIYVMLFCLSSMRTSTPFDPYETLGIGITASEKQIKKAFRTMSLKYHPDKNKNDPSSAAKFLLVSKAYHTLTDENAKKNFEKYGNPDGAGMMKVGIGLPSFLVTEGNQVFILAVFILILLVITPLVFLRFYQKVREYAPNGLKNETTHFLAGYMSERVPPQLIPQFVAATTEAREIGFRPSDVKDLQAAQPFIKVPPQGQMFKNPIVQKNVLLLYAHLQRKTDALSSNLQSDLKELLRRTVPVTKGMIDIAFMNNWIPTIQAVLTFRKAIFQALDIGNLPIMQLPHTTEERAMTLVRFASKSQPKDFRELIESALDQRKDALVGYSAEEIQDIETVYRQIPNIELSAKVFVEDEDEVCAGDVATCSLTFRRGHLKKGQAQGPMHAPYHPEIRCEEWFFFISDAQTSKFRKMKYSGILADQLYGCKTTKALERETTIDVQFPVLQPGTKKLIIVALSDAYFGVDRNLQVEFTAVSEGSAKRRLFVHPDDVALDTQPTLFQQVMGGQGEAGEPEEEEEEE